MPLFYFRPFDFHPEPDRSKPPIIDAKPSEIVTLVVAGLVAFALFLAFIVLPAVMVVAQAMP